MCNSCFVYKIITFPLTVNARIDDRYGRYIAGNNKLYVQL